VIIVLQVNHADFDRVVGLWGAMFEVHLHSQCVPARWVELKLVVVGKPMALGALGDGPNGREILLLGAERGSPAASGYGGHGSGGVQ
jgi:hypothetical protein